MPRYKDNHTSGLQRVPYMEHNRDIMRVLNENAMMKEKDGKHGEKKRAESEEEGRTGYSVSDGRRVCNVRHRFPEYLNVFERAV